MGIKDVDLQISGSDDGLVQALGQAKAAVLDATTSMRSALSGVQEGFKALQEGFLAVTAIMAGGRAFKEAIDQTKEITSSAIALGKILGTSATEASALAVALDDVGGKAEDFSLASQGLTRQLKNHEKALNDMGIATRDANLNLLSGNELMFNAIDAVNSYKEGTDRNLAAQVAFGRGMSATNAIFKLTKEGQDEAKKSAQELGLIVGQEDVDAYKENKKATNEAIDVLKGMAKAVGDAVLPVLTQLSEWFREIGPGAIVVIKGAVGGLVSVFWGLVTVVRIVGDTIVGIFDTIAAVFNGVMRAMMAALHRDFEGAANSLKGIPKEIGSAWSTAWDKIVTDSTTARDKIFNLFADKTPAKAAPEGKKFNLAQKDDGPDNRLALLKNALNEMAQARGDFDHKDVAADLQYWQSLLANTIGNSKKQVELRTQISKEILTLQKKQHDQEIQMQAEAIKTQESLAIGEIEAKRQELQQQLALGNITRRQEVQAEIQFANQEFQIKQQTLQREMALNQLDLVGQQKLKNEELKLEQKHAADVQKILNKEVLEEHKVWDNLFKQVQTGWQQTISKFLQGSLSISGAVKGIFQSVTSSVINSLATMAAKNLEVMAESLLLHKTVAMAQIKADAAKAGSAAYQAVVGIPYVGPFLAPAAAAVAYGATLAFGTSAKGGYDIPGNVNPVVQTHAREMILPQPIADPLRQMIKRGQMGGGGDINITAVDARSLNRMLVGSGSRSPLAKGLRALNKRNYTG